VSFCDLSQFPALVLDRLLARADTQIERNPLLKLLASDQSKSISAASTRDKIASRIGNPYRPISVALPCAPNVALEISLCFAAARQREKFELSAIPCAEEFEINFRSATVRSGKTGQPR
jgi:hypothetical protein